MFARGSEKKANLQRLTTDVAAEDFCSEGVLATNGFTIRSKPGTLIIQYFVVQSTQDACDPFFSISESIVIFVAYREGGRVI